MRQSLNELLLRMEIYYFVDVRFLKHLLVVIKSVPLPKKRLRIHTLNHWLDIQLHLVIESRIISIMSVIDLPFVVDNSKQIIFIHRLRSRTSKFAKKNNSACKKNHNSIIIKTTNEKAEPLFSFSVSFKAGVVKGAIFRDAGKRTAVSIFRAEDLSFVLCSNLYRI